MSDCNIIINNQGINNYNVLVDDNIQNINVSIDTKSPNLGYYYSLLSDLSSNYINITNATTNIINNSSSYLNQNEIIRLNEIISLSAKWQETALEVDTIQNDLSAKWQETALEVDTIQIDLSGKWQETAYEVDTIQTDLSANWEETYKTVKTGVIDGGFC